MNQIEITEYEQARFLALDQSQRDRLLCCGGNLSLSPEPATENLWSVRAASFVGTVVAPGLLLRIRPKLDIARLFVMMSAAAGAIRWNDRIVRLSHASTVEDVIAAALVDSINHSLGAGILRGYVEIEEESFVVRGRLALAETARRRPAILAPFVQTPEYFEEDIPENRIIATAVKYLAPRVQCPVIRGRLLAAQRTFAGVSIIRVGAPLPKVARNRLNARWWDTVELAVLVLRSCGLDPTGGTHASRSFLVDMNVVFERFVYHALAAELRKLGYTLECNRRGLYLDLERQHALRPDLSIWRGARCAYAADCKYKYTADARAVRDDVYQCLAYATATGLPAVTLIYGGGAGSGYVSIVDERTTIRVEVLDLAAPLESLRSHVGELALEIARSLR